MKRIKKDNEKKHVNKQKKIQSMNAAKDIIDKIPFLRIYENGMIESKPYYFVKTYQLLNMKKELILNQSIDLFFSKLEQFINNYGIDCTLQFTAFNKEKEQNNEVSFVVKRDNERIKKDVELYNNVIKENKKITNNNIIQTKYFSIGISADTADEAVEQFKKIDQIVSNSFHEIYEMEIKPLDMTGYLFTLYQMHNIGQNQFGKIAGIQDKIDVSQLKRLHLSVKDLVAPQAFDSRPSLKNHMVFNNQIYARTFFVNTVPKKIADFFLSDITNIVGNLIYSVTIEPYDAEFGRNLFKNNIINNTKIETVRVNRTLEDKRLGRTEMIETMLEENENFYFQKAALDVCTEAVSKGQYIFGCSAIMTVFADSLEKLESYSHLISISANKYAVNIRTVDGQQLKAFQSVLPLCNTKIDVKRIYPAQKAVRLIPLDFNSITKENGLYYGLNAFTDALVLLNRKNHGNLTGMITGSKMTGKTYQMKREIFNTLISSDDTVFIITDKEKDYQKFMERYQGTLQHILPSPYSGTSGYALNDEPADFKKLFLKGLMNIVTNRTSDFLWIKRKDERVQEQEKDILKFIERSMEEMLGAEADEVTDFLHEYDETYQKGLQSMDVKENQNSLQGYIVNNTAELFRMIEYVWIQAVILKQNHKNASIFIENIDRLFEYPSARDFFIRFINYCNILEIPVTFTIQDPLQVALTNHLETNEFLKTVGFVKLLNLDIKERQFFTDLYNIPNVLSKYISVAENGHIGSGIIITNTSNIAFDDSFTNCSGDFYEFHKIFENEIKQNTISYLNLNL